MSTPYVQLHNVRLGESGASEMDGERPLVHIPRAEIERIESRYGTGAERPSVMLVLGIVLVAIAVIPILALVGVFTRGGTYYVEWIAAVACVIPGVWLIDLSLRKRWLLIVVMKRGRRKLLFPKGVSQVEVEAFVSGVRDRFGY